MRSLPSIASSAAVLLIIWCCLTLSLDPQEIVLGIAAAIIIAAATGGVFTGNLLRLLKPSRFIALLNFVLYFLLQMTRANIDVFLRIIRPRISVRPGIVRAEVPLSSARARIIVANSITLTPGTLTVDLQDRVIYVHWISLPHGDVHAKTQKMVDGFARRVKKIIE